MEKSYIINLPDNVQWVQWVCVSDGDGHAYFGFKDPQDLEVYDKPDIESIRKEAYDNGFKAAKVQCDLQAERDLRETGERHYQKGREDAIAQICSNEQELEGNAYQSGLADAWMIARKIVLPVQDGGYSPLFLNSVFGCSRDQTIMATVSAQEAIEKIRQFIAQDDEKIKQWDEVEYVSCGETYSFIVTRIDEEDGFLFGFNRETGNTDYCDIKEARKTGKRFTEINEIMQKKEGGEENGESESE